MRIPYSNFQDAEREAVNRSNTGRTTWYVNRLASSGPMRYEVSTSPMDSTFGGGTVLTVLPPVQRKGAK